MYNLFKKFSKQAKRKIVLLTMLSLLLPALIIEIIRSHPYNDYVIYLLMLPIGAIIHLGMTFSLPFNLLLSRVPKYLLTTLPVALTAGYLLYVGEFIVTLSWDHWLIISCIATGVPAMLAVRITYFDGFMVKILDRYEIEIHLNDIEHYKHSRRMMERFLTEGMTDLKKAGVNSIILRSHRLLNKKDTFFSTHGLGTKVLNYKPGAVDVIWMKPRKMTRSDLWFVSWLYKGKDRQKFQKSLGAQGVVKLSIK